MIRRVKLGHKTKTTSHLEKVLIMVVLVNALIFSACAKDDEIVELVRQSLTINTPLAKMTGEEFTSQMAAEGAKKGIIYEWKVQETDEEGIYIAEFVEKGSGWGHRWEVDYPNQIVRHINVNKFLQLKYGMSRLKGDRSFTIESVEQDTLKFKYHRIWTGEWVNDGIVYRISGEVKNNTDKTITDARLWGKVFVVFNVDKIIEAESPVNKGIRPAVTTNRPWLPDSTRKFQIETEPIDKIYKEYKPSQTFCELEFRASDPIGYDYEGVVAIKNINWSFE